MSNITHFVLVLLIAKNNKPIFREAYGVADKAHNPPNTVETKFNLGSMNKMFTGVRGGKEKLIFFHTTEPPSNIQVYE